MIAAAPTTHVQRISALARARNIVVAIALVLTLSLVCLANPSFASLENARDLLVQAAPTIIVGCGMTFVILTGEIDISVGSLFGLLAAIMGLLSSPQHAGAAPAVVIAVTLLAGTAAGFMNGVLITIAKVPSIVATLGMLTILRGVTEISLGGNWITDLPPAIRTLGTGKFLALPICLWTALLVAACSLIIARLFPLGLKLRAVGGNVEAAAFARISVPRVKLFAFTLVGFLTALAALVTVPQQSVIESGIGGGFELVVVTAVVVGGTSIRGGVGGIVGTLLAALLLGSIRTSLVFLKLGEMATFWERAIQGAFILAAVLADHVSAASAFAARAGGRIREGVRA